MSQELPAKAHVPARVGDRWGWGGERSKLGEAGKTRDLPCYRPSTRALTNAPIHSKGTSAVSHHNPAGTESHTDREAHGRLSLS